MEFRFKNASELQNEFTKSLNQKNSPVYQSKNITNIEHGEYSEDTNQYISSLSPEEFSDFIAKYKNAPYATIHLFKTTPLIALEKLKNLNTGIQKGYKWEEYDNFSLIAFEVLTNSVLFEYEARIEAANLLNYTSENLNRFNAQELREELSNNGLDPTIEEILYNK